MIMSIKNHPTLPLFFSLVLLKALLFPSLVFAKTKTTCHKEKSPVAYNYCVSVDPNSKNPDILYYFHGLDSNETRWSKKMGSKIYSAWAKAKEDAPTVVALSFPTKYWILLKENPKRPSTGLFETVSQKIIPSIESKLGGLKGRRLAFGESMGGINVSMLVTKAPDLLDKAAMVCPVIPEYSPYEVSKAALAIAGGADKRKIQEYVVMGLTMFDSTEDWKAEYPTYLIRDQFNANSPELYVSAGNSDSYGIFKPSENLAKVAKSKGVKTTWVPLKGGHCVFDFNSIAKFLVE
jgi:hypothetical protein